MDEMEKMLKEINVEETLREIDENIDFEELDKEWARNLDELDNLWSDNIRELSKWWIIKGDKGDILKKGIFENLKRRGGWPKRPVKKRSNEKKLGTSF